MDLGRHGLRPPPRPAGGPARTDGFTSLAMVIGAFGVLLGFPLADPIIGIAISIAILVLLIGTARSVGRRLLDGIEPDLLDTAEHAPLLAPGVRGVRDLRLRWVGHRLQGDATVLVDDVSVADGDRIAEEAERQSIAHLRSIDHLRVRVTATRQRRSSEVVRRSSGAHRTRAASRVR